MAPGEDNQHVVQDVIEAFADILNQDIRRVWDALVAGVGILCYRACEGVSELEYWHNMSSTPTIQMILAH
jgi:hypothetical protein